MQSNLLLKNINIITDENKEIIDGSILINEYKIVDTYYNLKKVLEYDKEIDMHHLNLLPYYFDKYDLIKDLDIISIPHPFNLNENDLLNIFTKDKYILIEIENFSLELLDYLFKNINRKRILVKGNIDNVLKIFKQLNIKLIDVALYLNMNYYRLLNDRRHFIKRGMDFDFILLNDEYDKLLEFKGSEYARLF